MSQDKKTSVVIEPHLTDFINSQIDGGVYHSASDVINAGLQMLEDQTLLDHKEGLRALHEALNAGIQSGKPRPFDFASFKERQREEFLAK